jgi:class 3 adenylate cyclase
MLPNLYAPAAMEAIPQTRYTQNDGANIAFQVVGGGELDVLLIDTWAHHVEEVWNFPDFARFLRRLASFGRLIHFDRRGTGLSDPVPIDGLPDLETQVDDAVAVLRAAGSEGASVMGVNDGGIIAVMLAAREPELCRSLVLHAFAPRQTISPELPLRSIDEIVAVIESSALNDESGVEFLAPSRLGDQEFDRRLARLQRLSVRPGVYGHFYRQTLEADVSNLLPAIRCPTLVLNRTGDIVVTADESREAAKAIPGARFVELPGTDYGIFTEGVDLLLDEVEEFLTGVRSGGDPDRMLTTLLFTDLVGSTDRAAQVGDRRWRDMLDRHNEMTRGELSRFAGREVSMTGDGFFATFDRPISAVRCALALVDAMPSMGLQIRAGVHTGEVEVRGADLGGLAVHIAARIMDLAGNSEVLVSSTVRDLLAGSEISFDDRSEHELKGVPGAWRLYSAAPLSS